MKHPHNSNIRQLFCVFAALSLSVLLGPSIYAASQTWDGGSVVDGNWATVTNWVGDPAAPGNTSSGATTTTDVATFNTVANTWGDSGTPIVIDAGRTINGINFDPGLTTDFYFGATGGNALYFNGQLKLSTAATYNLIIDAPLVTIGAASGATDKIRNNSLKNLTVNGSISGLNASANGVHLSADTTGLLTINGIISNGGATTYGILGNANTQTIILNGANTYTGATSITGTFSVASLNSVSGGSASSNLGAPVTVTDGTIAMGATTSTGTLKYTGTGETTDRVLNLAGTTGGAKIDQSGTGLLKFTTDLTASVAGAKTLTLQGSTAGTGEIAGAIVDSSGGATALIKAGAGTWALSGGNTYTGATTVSAGTLLINGNASSATGAVAVNAGTLGGNGTIGGDVTVANVVTAILAPGTASDSTETLTLNAKNLTFSGVSAQLKLDITGTAAGSFDKVVGINALTQNGDIVFTLSGTYGTDSWDVLDFSSKSGNFDTITLAGSYAGTLSRSVDTWTGTVGGQAWTFEQTTGLLSVVPEPSTWVLLALSLTVVTILHRRRQVR